MELENWEDNRVNYSSIEFNVNGRNVMFGRVTLSLKSDRRQIDGFHKSNVNKILLDAVRMRPADKIIA